MMKKGILIIRSRQWHRPKTTVEVTGEGLSDSISLEDFMKAIKAEMGPIMLTFKQETFEKQLDKAVAEVLKKL